MLEFWSIRLGPFVAVDCLRETQFHIGRSVEMVYSHIVYLGGSKLTYMLESCERFHMRKRRMRTAMNIQHICVHILRYYYVTCVSCLTRSLFLPIGCT
jgi:hypothetical protein